MASSPPPLTPEQAGAALQSINAVALRSATMQGYRHASPYFILWGGVWALAYALCDVLPQHGGAIWLLLDLGGAAASMGLARRRTAASIAELGGRGGSWRIAAAMLVLVGFGVATFAIFPVSSGRQVSTFIALMLATAYTLFGLWAGLRLVLIGLGLGALSLAGFFWVAQHFNLWMGALGGGALIAAGLWLRRI